jgi:hypothetical protein
MSSRGAKQRAGTRVSGCCSLLLLTVIACASPKNDAGDSATTLPAIDTLKPATDTLTVRDSVAAAATKSGQTTTARATKTSPAATKSRDSIIGRDVAIPMDPKKPKLDTVKRPPQR